MTSTEMQADLDATERDIEALSQVVAGLTRFIHEPHGEDRLFYKTDLFRYQHHLREAQALSQRIQEAMKGATPCLTSPSK